MIRKIKFKKWECEIKAGYYKNNCKALRLVQEGEPIATASVNLPDVNIPENHILIKDYSENIGMVDSLSNAGIIDLIIDVHQSGYVIIPECRLTKEGMGLWRT